MHNCVASHIPQVLANTAALYHGEIAGKPLTIQIAPASQAIAWWKPRPSPMTNQLPHRCACCASSSPTFAVA